MHSDRSARPVDRRGTTPGGHGRRQDGLPVTPIRGMALLSLQRRAGNRAVTGLVQRSAAQGPSVVQRRAANAATTARLRSAETRLDSVSAAASRQSTSLNQVSDGSIADLQAATAHLKKSSEDYKTGHQKFYNKLIEADARHELTQDVEGAVQGLLIAAVLAVLAPEALVVTAALRAAAGATSSTLKTIGLAALAETNVAATAAKKATEGALGEGVEQVAGRVVTATQSADVRPTSTAAGAGPTAGDRFEEAFATLAKMVGQLPTLGTVATAQASVALGAERLARDSARLRAGEQAPWTVEQIVAKVATLERLKAAGDTSLTQARSVGARLSVIKSQLIAKPALSPDEVEHRLWTSWMASLSGDAHNILDNKVLEDYLGPGGKNYFDFGAWWTSDSDTEEAVKSARRRWLTQHGITPGPYPDTQYQTKLKLDEIQQNVIGKTGVIVGNYGFSGPAVRVAGRLFTYAGNAGPLADGTPVVALLAMPQKGYLDGEYPIANVTDRAINILCNTVGDTAPAAPSPQ
jgi:hypothetical protein